MNLKPLTLVKYNYDALPDSWKKTNPNPYQGVDFMYHGEVSNMKGHAYCINMKNGMPYILHTINLIPLTPDEI